MMECRRCHAQMKLTYVWDDAQETDHSFNVWGCDDCGEVCKESVWEHPGKTWISREGEVVKEPPAS